MSNIKVFIFNQSTFNNPKMSKYVLNSFQNYQNPKQNSFVYKSPYFCYLFIINLSTL